MNRLLFIKGKLVYQTTNALEFMRIKWILENSSWKDSLTTHKISID